MRYWGHNPSSEFMQKYPSQEAHLDAASALAFSSPIHETNTELSTPIRQGASKGSITSPKIHLGPQSSSLSKQNQLLDDRNQPDFTLSRQNNKTSTLNDFISHPFSPEEIGSIDLDSKLFTSTKSIEEDIDAHHQLYSASLQKLDFIALAEYLTTPKPRKRKDGLVNRFWFYSEAVGVLEAPFLDSFDFRTAKENRAKNRSNSFSRESISTRIPNSAPQEVTSIFVSQESEASILSSNPFWIDVCDPTPSEMQTISSLFNIHPLTSEDILTHDTREKCEVFQNYYFVVIKTFVQDELSEAYLRSILFFIVVFKECVITFHSTPVPHPRNVARRIDQVRCFGLQITPDWINYAVIDDITDGFIPVLSFIEFEVDAIDDLVLILKESEQSDMLRRIGHSRKKVLLLMRLLNTKSDVLKTIIKRCGDGIKALDETCLYLGDIQDHVLSMTQNITHYEKTLARAHSNYLAQISIEITQSNNRTNDIAMKITTVASILIPLNVVTGLWGMNVKVPGQDDESLFFFIVIVSSMILFAAVTIYVVRRYRLL